MPEEGLPHLVVDSKTLQAGRKRVPEVMKVEVLNLGQRAGPGPILLESADVLPASKDPTVGDRGEGITQSPQRRPIQWNAGWCAFQSGLAWGSTSHQPSASSRIQVR